MNVSRRSPSLDAPLFEGEEKTLFSYLSDDETMDLEEQMFESARQKEIRETLGSLRIRQIKARALDRLRHTSRSRRLEPYH